MTVIYVALFICAGQCHDYNLSAQALVYFDTQAHCLAYANRFGTEIESDGDELLPDGTMRKLNPRTLHIECKRLKLSALR
jgi:hypothetical protein